MAVMEYQDRVEATLDLIETSPAITDHNATLLRDYYRDRRLEGLQPATLQKNLSYLKIVAEHVGDRPLDDLETPDIKDLVDWTQSRDVKPGTVNTYKEIIRLFWTWLHQDDLEDGEYPACVEWITTDAYTTGKLPQNLLTPDDIDAQIAAANNYRDKALISVLWETGARIGELIDLKVGDIEDRDTGKQLHVDGKTGARRLPLRDSEPYLNRWLHDHPHPEPARRCGVKSNKPPHPPPSTQPTSRTSARFMGSGRVTPQNSKPPA